MITLFGWSINILQIIGIIFGMGFIILVHEIGHFASAKKCGVTVESFTIGMGPEIVGYTYKGTRYALCAVPLGGMCKMLGESIDETTGSGKEFFSQPWYNRIFITAAGPAMNYLLAVILFTIVIYTWGIGEPSQKAMIGELLSGKPAAEAGLQSDDVISAINGVPIDTWEQMSEIIHGSPEKQLSLSIQRGEKTFDVTLVPEKDPATEYGMIGITVAAEMRKVSILRSVDYSVRMVIFQSIFTLRYLGEHIIRLKKPEGLAGPVGVVQILAKAAKAGLEQMLHILAVISTALGLFNLLPIPLVDGGHIMFAIVEGITRKRLNKKLIYVSNIVGLALIISIFVFATYNDIGRLGLKILGK